MTRRRQDRPQGSRRRGPAAAACPPRQTEASVAPGRKGSVQMDCSTPRGTSDRPLRPGEETDGGLGGTGIGRQPHRSPADRG